MAYEESGLSATALTFEKFVFHFHKVFSDPLPINFSKFHDTLPVVVSYQTCPSFDG